MNDEATRSIPGWLAAVVQDFELSGERLITLDDVARARHELDRALVRQGIAQLVQRGWLRPVGVRGTYEFIPGAAAGPYPSGDPWLVLRAELRRHPGVFHVGAASAAWLLGYAQRSPAPHTIVTTPNVRTPRPLATTYRVLRTDPAPASGAVDGLPVPTPPELFAEVAQLAPRLVLNAARGWLRRLLDDASPGEVAAILRDRGVATRARAGYLAEICGATEHAAAIAALGPLGDGPFYTGPRRADGTFSPRWRVYDTNQIGAP
jgi:hypothetical protein